MRLLSPVSMLLVGVWAVGWCGSFPLSLAEEKEGTVRLPELPTGKDLASGGTPIYLNIDRKGCLLVPGEKPEALTDREAVEWVSRTVAAAKRKGGDGKPPVVVLRADHAAPATSVLGLAQSGGAKSFDLRGLKPSPIPGGVSTEARLVFGWSEAGADKVVAVTLLDPKEAGGVGEWQVTKPGGKPEAVEPTKLGERLRALLGKEQVVVLVVGKSRAWSSVVQTLAVCHEAGVKEIVLGKLRTPPQAR